MRPSPDAVQLTIFQSMSPSAKLALAAELRQVNLDLLAAGIRARRGELPADDLRIEILKLVLPERLFRAAYRPH